MSIRLPLEVDEHEHISWPTIFWGLDIPDNEWD